MKRSFVLIGLLAIVGIAVAVFMRGLDFAKPAAAASQSGIMLAKGDGAASVLPPGHPQVSAAPVDLENINVSKASGPDARTVEEVITKRVELKGETVLVRGKVVKFTPEILGMNWVHLRDGSGSASNNTNDVLVTTKDRAKVGDVVVVKGVVHINKDLGSGYLYDVLIEEATLRK